jgi:hypothetical protein
MRGFLFRMIKKIKISHLNLKIRLIYIIFEKFLLKLTL